MEHALKLGPLAQLVSATGGVIEPVDSDRRTLHLVPLLFVDCADLVRIQCKNVTLSVTVDGKSESGRHRVPVVRQPVPNRRYFIGGTESSRYGWTIPLAPDQTAVSLMFQWTIAEGPDGPSYAIEHVLDVRLQPGAFRTYSMDPTAWHRVMPPGFMPLDHKPYARLRGEGFQRTRTVRVEALESASGSRPPSRMRYTEELELPAIPRSDVVSIEGYATEQLHELSQTSTFASNSEHRGNACAELPVGLLVDAVHLARTTPFGAATRFGVGRREEHPALRSLCTWWNANTQDQGAKSARFAVTWVRVREDACYWPADLQMHPRRLDELRETQPGNAVVGDAILLQFMRGAADYRYTEEGVEAYTVSGHCEWITGVGREEIASGAIDDAYDALCALAGLPEAFPAAWTRLVALASSGSAYGAHSGLSEPDA